jgi:hypothetical protein
MPNGRVLSLASDTNGNLSFRALETSAATMAQNYPAGTYQFVFTTSNDGLRTSSVQLASTKLPPIPRMRNFTNLIALKPEVENTISWDPWVDINLATDRIRLTLESRSGDVVYDSEAATGKAISAATNQVAIDDDLLPVNTLYIARLRFERRERFENPSYPGAKGDASVYSEVAFYLGTLNPRFVSYGVLDGQAFFSANLSSGRTFALMTSTDLKTWTPVKTVRVTSSTTRQTFGIVPSNERAFYRWELVL